MGKRRSDNIEILSSKTVIQDLCNRDLARITQKLKGYLGEFTYIVISPSWEQVSWHIARAEYVGKILRQKVPTAFGAITRSQKSWVYWYQDFRSEQLMIQRIVLLQCEEEEHVVSNVKELLVAASAEAKAWGLKQVVFWNPERSEIMHAASQMEAEAPNGLKVSAWDSHTTSIPSLRLRNGADTTNLVWLHNGYYGWC
jgi:hypothetical protein